MPALKRIALPDCYAANLADDHRKAVNEKNDCTVMAMVTVTGLPYAVCHAALEAEGRKIGRGAYTHQYVKALASLGFEARRWSVAEMVNLSRSYWDLHRKQVANITTHHPRRFPKCFEGKGPLMLKCNGHVAGMDANGVVHDWTINRSMRVIEIYSVTKVR